MAAISEKGKSLLKWCPSDPYRSSYDRIFGKKRDCNAEDITDEEKAEDELFIAASKAVECPKSQPFTPETLKETFAKIEEWGIR
jgi:hypothetical protein